MRFLGTENAALGMMQFCWIFLIFPSGRTFALTGSQWNTADLAAGIQGVVMRSFYRLKMHIGSVFFPPGQS